MTITPIYPLSVWQESPKYYIESLMRRVCVGIGFASAGSVAAERFAVPGERSRGGAVPPLVVGPVAASSPSSSDTSSAKTLNEEVGVSLSAFCGIGFPSSCGGWILALSEPSPVRAL